VKIPTVDNWAVWHEKDIEWYNTLILKGLAKNGDEFKLDVVWQGVFSKERYDNIKMPVMIVLVTAMIFQSNTD
jgi:hypothetical protein